MFLVWLVLPFTSAGAFAWKSGLPLSLPKSASSPSPPSKKPCQRTNSAEKTAPIISRASSPATMRTNSFRLRSESRITSSKNPIPIYNSHYFTTFSLICKPPSVTLDPIRGGTESEQLGHWSRLVTFSLSCSIVSPPIPGSVTLHPIRGGTESEQLGHWSRLVAFSLSASIASPPIPGSVTLHPIHRG